jgi:hypothetical protein
MKTFHCNRCSQLVFFENVRCERCEARLGYVPELGEISAFEPVEQGQQQAQSEQSQSQSQGQGQGQGQGQPRSPELQDQPGQQTQSTQPLERAAQPPQPAVAPELWRSLHPDAQGRLYRMCDNYALENVCNWMVAADDPHSLCVSCELTTVIPNLAPPENRMFWYRLEAAKRRLLYTLAALKLPIEPMQADSDGGVAFEFLEDSPGGKRVLTGHDNGRITLNIAEADDAQREQARTQMHEPYRTLLGHFRHEIGHYYFDRLVADTQWTEPFRTLFGDEREDYGEALERHYREGPPPDWSQTFISAYATTHPWEDWAETWAHYLHMIDTLDTAMSCGLALVPDDPREPTLTDNTPVEDAGFDSLLKRWFPLTYVLNSLNRSLGMPDGYPFTLAPKVADKLRFVHRVVSAGALPKEDGSASPDSNGPNPAALDLAGPNSTGPGPGPTGPNAAGPNTAGSNTAGSNAAGLNTAGPNTAGPNTAGPNPPGPANVEQEMLGS